MTSSICAHSSRVTKIQLDAFRSSCDEMMSCYLDLKVISGLRRKDLLRLTSSNIKDDGLHLLPSGRDVLLGDKRIITMSAPLNSVLLRLSGLPRAENVNHLFCNDMGLPFVNSRFQKYWEMQMEKAISESALESPFKERDLDMFVRELTSAASRIGGMRERNELPIY